MADDKNKTTGGGQPPPKPSLEERFAKLEDAYGQLQKKYDELKSRGGGGVPAVIATRADFEAERARVESHEKRLELREKTHKPGDGMHEYIVGAQPSYYGGRMYQPGERVRISETELPSITWKPAPAPAKSDEDVETAPIAVKAKAPRAADQEL